MNEDWEEIFEDMKSFAKLKDITDIILLDGDGNVRRILVE